MTIGRMVYTGIGALILGLISAIITRNLFVGIMFPILLIGFLILMNYLKKEEPAGEITEEAVSDTSQPPVSTQYPPKQPTL